MAGEVHSSRTKVHLAGYDVSSALDSTSTDDSIETSDVSTLPDLARRYIAGLEDGTFSADGFYSNTAEGILAALDALTKGENLASNPSFEVDTVGWAAAGTATIARVNTQAKDGGWSCEVQAADAGTGVDHVTFWAEPNQVYIASAWVKAPLGVQLKWRFEEHDAAGAGIGSGSERIFTGTGDWQRVEVRRLFSAAGEQVQNLGIRTVNAGAGTFHLDAVRLRKAGANGVCVWPDTDAIGKPGEGLGGVGTAKAVTTPIGDAVKVSAQLQSSLGVESLVSLANLAQRGAGAGGLASVDNGASSALGLSAYLHVADMSLETETATVKVQHSTDDAIWVDLVTFGKVHSDHFFQRKHVAGTVNRFLRANVIATGAATTTLAVGASRAPSNPQT